MAALEHKMTVTIAVEGKEGLYRACKAVDAIRRAVYESRIEDCEEIQEMIAAMTALVNTVHVVEKV